MDSRVQCTNARLFADCDARINTEWMTKTAAQLIGDALDSAMQTADNGKPMSQAELSRRSGVPQPTISRTLSGKTIPETQTLAALIDVLGTGNVNLAASIEALLPTPKESNQTIAPLVAKIFALPCASCGHVSHQSFIDLETNDEIACPDCGTRINVAYYYGQTELAEFLKSIGGSGFVARKRK